MLGPWEGRCEKPTGLLARPEWTWLPAWFVSMAPKFPPNFLCSKFPPFFECELARDENVRLPNCRTTQISRLADIVTLPAISRVEAWVWVQQGQPSCRARATSEYWEPEPAGLQGLFIVWLAG